MTVFEVYISFKRQTEFSYRVTASKGPQVTQVTKDYLALRAFQEKGVPQDWACRAPKASLVFPEMLDYLDHQASPVLLVPQAFQDK